MKYYVEYSETKTKEVFKKGEIEKLPEWIEVDAEKYNL
jgi:hypothetical protein